MDDVADFRLPSLNPFLKLYRAPTAGGEPAWTLHNPAANSYFRLSWAQFECLSRFSRAHTAQALKVAVENETTLRITIDDVAGLVRFLQENGLVSLKDQTINAKHVKYVPWWKKILHGYLFIILPLFKPEPFLRRTLPFVRPLLSPAFFKSMMALMAVGVLMTLQRFDEFTHTAANLFSVEGAITAAIVLIFVKIVHEMAHAWTAVKENIPVPHMGVALMVLYPVLYTETTGGWQISSRRGRMAIGLAGIRAELCVAALALLLWHILPAGSIGQGLSFVVVAVALVSSLLVNLNPLMRFDGYYLLSDLTGIENLQTRSCDFARWRLRQLLFGWTDPPPEVADPGRARFLIWFGFALLLYRFFLFVGIALLVYHIFFKPLGLILMAVEIAWFIVLPVWMEIKIWLSRGTEIVGTKRGRVWAVLVAMLFFLMFLPVSRTVNLPAVIHAHDYLAVYPPVAAKIDEWLVEDGKAVRQGTILARLSSAALTRDLMSAQTALDSLQTIGRRVGTTPELAQGEYADIAQRIETAQRALSSLQDQAGRLVITAPFNGVVRDMNPELRAGRTVPPDELLFRLVNPDVPAITAYISEQDARRIRVGDVAFFRADIDRGNKLEARVTHIAETGAAQIIWPELSSVFGGAVASEIDPVDGRLIPVGGVYKVELNPVARRDLVDRVLSGQVMVNARAVSPFSNFIKSLTGLVVRESGLN
ncbi:MAG: efflux RND transporter periplasmic adaptor subunit [Alphaproteobacteria bacterium]|nr:efflux RND transporter periplasmic adaptor subunit [Alphaproteobacteria bacterium]